MAFAAQLQRLLEQCAVSRAAERAQRLCDPEDGGMTEWQDLVATQDALLVPYLPSGKISLVKARAVEVQRRRPAPPGRPPGAAPAPKSAAFPTPAFAAPRPLASGPQWDPQARGRDSVARRGSGPMGETQSVERSAVPTVRPPPRIQRSHSAGPERYSQPGWQAGPPNAAWPDQSWANDGGRPQPQPPRPPSAAPSPGPLARSQSNTSLASAGRAQHTSPAAPTKAGLPSAGTFQPLQGAKFSASQSMGSPLPRRPSVSERSASTNSVAEWAPIYSASTLQDKRAGGSILRSPSILSSLTEAADLGAPRPPSSLGQGWADAASSANRSISAPLQRPRARTPEEVHLSQPISYHTSHYNVTSYPLDSGGNPVYSDAFRARVTPAGLAHLLDAQGRTSPLRPPSPSARLSPLARGLAAAASPPAPPPAPPPLAAFPHPVAGAAPADGSLSVQPYGSGYGGWPANVFRPLQTFASTTVATSQSGTVQPSTLLSLPSTIHFEPSFSTVAAGSVMAPPPVIRSESSTGSSLSSVNLDTSYPRTSTSIPGRPPPASAQPPPPPFQYKQDQAISPPQTQVAPRYPSPTPTSGFFVTTLNPTPVVVPVPGAKTVTFSLPPPSPIPAYGSPFQPVPSRTSPLASTGPRALSPILLPLDHASLSPRVSPAFQPRPLSPVRLQGTEAMWGSANGHAPWPTAPPRKEPRQSPVPFPPAAPRLPSPKRTDNGALASTISQYNVWYAEWKSMRPRPLQGPTLPRLWAFTAGEVLEVTLAQVPSLSPKPLLVRDLVVLDPAVLQRTQAVLPHYPEAQSWVFRALRPGRTEVVYVEVYNSQERAELRFEVVVS